ncbi:Protein of unknown function (DUF742) [Streptoalloteichus tenebrarius]|uniref:DUF742 domain-containing protein n=1 Tax=Streptoalloteichus tenebrarius (strain ATCC 17920 / DSM 40477 / JCM 4838 / CBS 697.72 / NBRC 16177 / NCIMB 11028 / NRRL B-12390 / A12253. 1 / ISP 5477) TaxID=1933 RepID=A0ABT1HVE3_STRSD|nr:DUF742 domain-containing protein [Streptoalloteichus tenebrarius]MCP2259496.1 Protein of unknown function (DUF742) [Streptoalloteichus tenebrarius]BFF01424.1 DUF742 domain-containing protein [Streptoalloteichus tenebrarius]
MNTGPDFSDGRFDYRDWAASGFRFDGYGEADQSDEAAHETELAREDGLPSAPSTLDGYGGGLFGGPGADLFGTSVPDYPPTESGEQPVNEWSAVSPAVDPAEESGSLVRPYARTRGRTRPDYDLAIEALVSTSDRGLDREAAVLAEHRSICGLCVETRSVAEIAAHLRLPLGVVRVLIGDMAGLGLVMIHEGGVVSGDRPSLAFLERVLSGLRRL